MEHTYLHESIQRARNARRIAPAGCAALRLREAGALSAKEALCIPVWGPHNARVRAASVFGM